MDDGDSSENIMEPVLINGEWRAVASYIWIRRVLAVYDY